MNDTKKILYNIKQKFKINQLLIKKKLYSKFN